MSEVKQSRICGLKPDRSQVIKLAEFANAPAGCECIAREISTARCPPEQGLVGLEATSRYGENLYGLFQAFDDEKPNKRAGERMKHESLIIVVFNRSSRRTRQATDARLLAIADAGTGGDS